MALALVALTVASYGLGWAAGVPALIPILNALAGVPFMALALRRGAVRLAIARMLVWALALGVCATLLSYGRPAATDTLFLNGASYRTEMFTWVLTGRGAESTPSQFIPQQARDAAIFAGVALATGGVLAMAMGAVLMNYMGHYVGALAASSARPGATMLLAWAPWAVVRVISFVAIGVALAMPIWARVGRRPIDWTEARAPLALACAGLLVDVVTKWLMAPAWHRLLLRVVGW